MRGLGYGEEDLIGQGLPNPYKTHKGGEGANTRGDPGFWPMMNSDGGLGMAKRLKTVPNLPMVHA